MKITIETDLNILRESPPDMQTVIIDQQADGLDEVLQLFEQALRAMGYSFDGHLEVVDEEV